AAFGRLCVETSGVLIWMALLVQPPSGGCVLKLCDPFDKTNRQHQPPSGGCVLKRLHCRIDGEDEDQPPSGGCVL
ncbi:hypothetical protein HMPREF2560_05475, partial [Neisseria sp. HMSC078H04]